MGAVEVMRLAMLMMNMGHDAKVNWDKMKAIKAKAEAEGRPISNEELGAAVDDMEEAIGSLNKMIASKKS